MVYLSWPIRRYGIAQLWEAGLTGEGVAVGLVDTGCAGDLPVFTNRLAAYRELDANGDAIAGAKPADLDGHGTHNAGIICGGSVKGLRIGVAPGAKLCVIRALDGGQTIARILCGLDWMLDCGVKVVCLPLGLQAATPVFDVLIDALWKRGVLPVASVGNRAPGRICAPAHHRRVLSVGAVDRRERVCPFSGSLHLAQGRTCYKPDLLAAGDAIPSVDPRGKLVRVSGTSMASAFVAGVTALLFQARPRASAAAVWRALVGSARPVCADDAHRTLHGLIDPVSATARLERGTCRRNVRR